MIAVALDPGITTGYAIGIIDDGMMTVVSGQERYTHYSLWKFLKEETPDFIISESFEFRRAARDNLILYSIEMIGVIRLYCEGYDKPLHMQSAATGKGYYNDSKLQSARLYKPTRPHANDAVRHLLQWFTFGPGFKYNTKGFKSGA